jgi:hypothetical protein
MKKRKLILAGFACALVLISVHVGDTSAQTTEAIQQRFNVFLKIAPEQDSQPIRHGENLSWKYNIELVVSSTSDDVTRQMPPAYLLAGETKSKSAEIHGDRIAYEVGIDASGEKAHALVEISRDGVPVFVQRLAIWLPPMPKDQP